jgi:hypothetical protein
MAPLLEALTNFLCKYQLIQNASHHVVSDFGMFMLQTLRSYFKDSTFSPKRCLPIVQYCYKLAARFGPHLRILQDMCSLFLECYSK